MGAAQGATRGLGETEDITDVKQTAKDVATGAAIEGIGSGVIGAVGKGVGKVAGNLKSKYAPQRRILDDIDDTRKMSADDKFDAFKRPSKTQEALGTVNKEMPILSKKELKDNLDEIFAEHKWAKTDKPKIKKAVDIELKRIIPDIEKIMEGTVVPALLGIYSPVLGGGAAVFKVAKWAKNTAKTPEGKAVLKRVGTKLKNGRKKYGDVNLYRMGQLMSKVVKVNPQFEKFGPMFNDTAATMGSIGVGLAHVELLRTDQKYRKAVTAELKKYNLTPLANEKN